MNTLNQSPSKRLISLFFNSLQVMIICLFSGLAFSAQTLDAKDFDLADYKGQVVYVDFWASWCVPCRASFPFMAELSRKYPDKLEIIAINVDEYAADAQAFLDEYDTPFTVVMDPEGSLAGEYDVPGMPTSFLFDHTGQLLGKHIGFRKKDRDAITQWIDDAINP